jgi:hypothetical protein
LYDKFRTKEKLEKCIKRKNNNLEEKKKGMKRCLKKV